MVESHYDVSSMVEQLQNTHCSRGHGGDDGHGRMAEDGITGHIGWHSMVAMAK